MAREGAAQRIEHHTTTRTLRAHETRQRTPRHSCMLSSQPLQPQEAPCNPSAHVESSISWSRRVSTAHCESLISIASQSCTELLLHRDRRASKKGGEACPAVNSRYCILEHYSETTGIVVVEHAKICRSACEGVFATDVLCQPTVSTPVPHCKSSSRIYYLRKTDSSSL
ncbi:hypothetical protein BDW02DRAFT_386571 [Decorospora gaudefroyi]|uniref:Uncharacterized protein n=1 Tax=Decorospora gaudefroyi TaxID=184978 RepID=A0A6A5KFK0_9PLEO|nr:hypothetical protein BDW02DRAFT_386571 [Decorospora gaudefroyi]